MFAYEINTPNMISGTLYNYFHSCHRKMWLHAHHIRMEHSSELVFEGKLLHQTAYPQRAERFREIQLEGAKIDFYEPEKRLVHEIKKSDKKAHAHQAQLKYYLWLLERSGVQGVRGLLEYPLQRKSQEVQLSPAEREEIAQKCQRIQQLLAGPCPPRLPKSKCRNCSYFDFCYAGEQVGSLISH